MGNPHPNSDCPENKPFFSDPDTEALRIKIQIGIDARFSHLDEEHEETEDDE